MAIDSDYRRGVIAMYLSENPPGVSLRPPEYTSIFADALHASVIGGCYLHLTGSDRLAQAEYLTRLG